MPLTCSATCVLRYWYGRLQQSDNLVVDLALVQESGRLQLCWKDECDGELVLYQAFNAAT